MKPVVECALIDDCLAQKKSGETMLKKPYKTGEKVIGIVVDLSPAPDRQFLALQTKDGYVIPEPFLNVIGEVEKKPTQTAYYEEINDVEEKENKDFTPAINSVKDYIAKETKDNKAIMQFALSGLVVGVLLALYLGKSKLVYGGIGLVGGGLLGRYVNKKVIND